MSALIYPIGFFVALMVLVAVAYGLPALRRRREHFARTQAAREHYEAGGATYTAERKGPGSSDDQWRERVHGVRHGFPYTAHSEVREVAPSYYSASDIL